MIIQINTVDASPIYEQLRDQIVLGIACKDLSPGEVLPSVRRLAADLGINFHTVSKAYAMLCDEGYIVIDRRKGAVVTQPMESDEVFISALENKLTLRAAEANCHNITENEYMSLCKDCFKKAQGKNMKGGK